jgi:hypothetical protein
MDKDTRVRHCQGLPEAGTHHLAEARTGPQRVALPATTPRATTPVAPGARMYGWLVRHNPGYAQAAWGSSPETPLGIPVLLTERSLDQALGLDGRLDEETLDDSATREYTARRRGQS